MADITLGGLLLPIIGSLIYAGVFALKNMQGGQTLDPVKFFATMLIGVVIGGIAIVTGVVPTELDVEAQLVAFAGLTAVVESVLKLFKRAIWPDAPAPAA